MARRNDKKEKVDNSAAQPIVLFRITDEEIAREKKLKLVMWLIVGMLALAIFASWAINIQKFIGKDAIDSKEIIKLEDYKKSFKENFQEINSGIRTIKQEISSTTMIEASSTAETAEAYNTNVGDVNKELEKIINKASSTINNK